MSVEFQNGTRGVRFVFFVAVLFTVTMAILPRPPAIPGEPPDKVLHIIAFAALGTLAAVAYWRASIAMIFVALSGLGALIELIQLVPALNRDSDWLDLLADMGAALVALVVARLILRLGAGP